MSRVETTIPSESDLLCESCGYTLNGLPQGSNCPECGEPIGQSLGTRRHPPEWEKTRGGSPGAGAFIRNSAKIIFRPTEFFQTTTTRGDVPRAKSFGHYHWLIASIIFGMAGSLHSSLFARVGSFNNQILAGVHGVAILAILAYLGLWGTTWLAMRLTAWEAAYRGYRLPINVVSRGMYYHAAHYLPVALGTLLTVGVYAILRATNTLDVMTLPNYLYVLCGEVIVAAAYLFKTYWIGMRNMMYANR